MLVPTEPTTHPRALLDERLRRARQGAGSTASGRAPIPPRIPGAAIPLSSAQDRLWFLGQLEPEDAAYNVCQAFRLTGPLDARALAAALDGVVGRHEVLRTTVTVVDGEARQVVGPAQPLPLPVIDLPASAVPGRLREEVRRPFDFTRDQPLRAFLFRSAPEDHTLLLVLPHLFSDGWSLGLLAAELSALYAAGLRGLPAPLPPLPVQFGDFAAWERSAPPPARLGDSLAYWRRQLAGSPPALDLPLDHPRPAVPSSRGATVSLLLPPELVAGLQALGREAGATLFMTLLAGFQVLLHRWTGQDDIVVGSVAAGRRRVELERLIGFFVHTLVLRSDLSGRPGFRAFLARVQETTLAAFAHQDVPFERLVRELRPERGSSRHPLFQVMFVLQSAPSAPPEFPGLRVEAVDVDTGTAKFDLTLSCVPVAAGLRADLEYSTDLFEPDTARRLLAAWRTLLEGAVAEPDLSVALLPLMPAGERVRLLALGEGPAGPYPRDQTLGSLFSAQVARTPDAIALSGGGERLTYRELDRRANQLAHRLVLLGVRPGSLVAVCLDRSCELVVALLAVVRAGGAYVGLDPRHPPERLALLLADTAAAVVLTRTPHLPALAGGPSAVVLCLDTDPEPAGDDTPPVVDVGPESLAYVSYTSGSTGRPKGVCIPHRGVVRLVCGTDYARFGPEEVFLQLAPVAFDASTFEIWGALLHGARLAVAPPGTLSLAELGDVLGREGVTTLWLTAGLFHQMVDAQLERLRGVRQLLAGGDVLSAPHVARVLARLPDTVLINGYGPTENTTFTCCHRFTAAPAAGHPVPIGRPIAHTRVHVLDREGQLVPVGFPGELHAGGDGLARGYLGRPDLTAERFVPDPFDPDPFARLYRTGDRVRWRADGRLEFLGRLDRQVKIRGFRVEPAEVESVLATHPGVEACAVAVRTSPAGERVLVAYVVPAPSVPPGPEEWRAWLAARVPDHLVPSGFVVLPSLPLNASGKVDLAALPAPTPSPARGGGAAPRDEAERRLAGLWSEVLGVPGVGRDDGFFELGGHSLLAVRLVARIEAAFGRRLPVAALFRHPTVAGLADLLRAGPAAGAAPPGSSLVELQGRGNRVPLFLVHGVGGGMFWGYANLARHLGPDQPVHAFRSRGLEGLPEWDTIEEMAASHVTDLRARRPHGPYLLGGYCFGGVVAYEMARQLAAQGADVPLLALFNCAPPNSGYQRPGPRTSLRWQGRFLANLAYWAGCFAFRWTARERAEFLRWKFRLLRRRTRRPLGPHPGELELADVDELVNLADYSSAQRAVWQTHVRALLRYQPGPYPGAVTLFRSRGHPLVCSFDPHYGWDALARGGVHLHLLPGGHGNLLAEPHVGAVAAALARSLAEAAPAAEARS